MKNSLLLLLLSASINAQTFTLDSTNNLPNIVLGDVKLVDVDGDDNLDLFLTGVDDSSGTSIRISKLYLNDGIGNFTESSSTFEALDNSTVDFADIDGDIDLDLIISGRDNLNQGVSILYTNNGSGVFTELTSANLISVSGSVEFADIDGDNDNDLLIVGDMLAALYINDGSGNFTTVSSNITGTDFGDIEFQDIDGDLDLDLLVVGSASGSTTNKAKLYRNDGLGVFTEITGSNLFLASFSSVSFGDIDGDLDSDLIITGQSNTETATKLYINDGSGNFTEDTSIVIEQVTFGEAVFEDINDDNSLDIIITGSNTSNTSITKAYINDSNGNFTELSQIFEGLGFLSRIEIGDINGDGDKDIFSIGSNLNGDTTTNLYKNNLYTLSINNFISDKTIIYPNPAQTYIHIETTTAINLYTIYDISGKLVLKENVTNMNGKKVKIDLSNLNIGSYIIQIELSDSSILRRKIIKT